MIFSELLQNYTPKQTGGKGDGKSPFDFDKNQLIVGLYVEREHSNDPNIALGIAIDHLSEKSDYYTRLIESGIVDEQKALELAKKHLNVEPKENNIKTEDEKLTDNLLGYNLNTPNSNSVNENLDFTTAELEYFKNPEMKEKLMKFEDYYKNWKTLDANQKNDAFKLYNELKMYKYDQQC